MLLLTAGSDGLFLFSELCFERFLFANAIDKVPEVDFSWCEEPYVIEGVGVQHQFLERGAHI